MNALKRECELWSQLRSDWESCEELLTIACRETEESLEPELRSELTRLEAELKSLKTRLLLSEEADPSSAFLTVHSGAGGTEACDWAHMLYRLYTRWTERKGFEWKMIDMVESEGGIRSISLQINGEYAYGLLKGETGVHRLVRISPFDSNSRRHTSFASVYVSPVLSEDITVEIRPEDIRIDTFRSSGAGGQHVNKTDSAIRITHLETNLTVQCQNERSQIKNREMAFKVLRSRLYEYYRKKQEEERAQTEAEKQSIGWGAQIRSYVFQPYTMVKDLRTSFQVGNIQAVMDGKIDDLINAYLLHRRNP